MKLTIYSNQYGYSALCKNKTQSGEELKYYLNVQFKRGLEPVNEVTNMTISDGFFSCYKDSNGNIKPKLVVMGWYEEKSPYNNQPKQEPDIVEPVITIPINSDDLPF